MDNNREFYAMCDSMWENYLKNKVLDLLRGSVRCYRAQVSANPGSNRLTVKKPFDDTAVTLPCVYSLRSASAGTQVIVLELGGAENSVVIANTALTNL